MNCEKKELIFIALVPDMTVDNTDSIIYTFYFYEKEDQIVVPIETSQDYANKFLGIHKQNTNPNIYNTFFRLIKSLKLKIKDILIYKSSGGVLYTYLNINYEETLLEINCNFWDALLLSKLFGTKIFMNVEVLKTEGIKVTKKMIRDALENDNYKLDY